MNKIAVVTGANTGLGYSLVKKLCILLGDNGTVYLTARNVQKGKEAIEKLNAIGLNPTFHQLDVNSETSVNSFSKFIADKH